MSFMVFTRARGKSPRRSHIVDTAEEARAYCQPRNERRSKRQRDRGFFYEFANLKWYLEAFGR